MARAPVGVRGRSDGGGDWARSPAPSTGEPSVGPRLVPLRGAAAPRPCRLRSMTPPTACSD